MTFEEERGGLDIITGDPSNHRCIANPKTRALGDPCLLNEECSEGFCDDHYESNGPSVDSSGAHFYEYAGKCQCKKHGAQCDPDNPKDKSNYGGECTFKTILSA